MVTEKISEEKSIQTKRLTISHSYTRIEEKVKGLIFPDLPKDLSIKIKFTDPGIGELSGRINGVDVTVCSSRYDLVSARIDEFPACCGVAMLSHIYAYSSFSESQEKLFEIGKDYFESLIISIIDHFKYSSIIAIRSHEENREWERVLPSFKKMGHQIINRSSHHKLEYYYFTF